MRQNKRIIKLAVRTPTSPLVHPNSHSMRTRVVYDAHSAKKTGGEDRFMFYGADIGHRSTIQLLGVPRTALRARSASIAKQTIAKQTIAKQTM